jgi:flagellar basal body-associated protein FliL
MSDSLILVVAIFVFITMLIGLGLTMWEFSKGQPHQESLASTPVPNGPASLQSAGGKAVNSRRTVPGAMHA